MVPRVLLVSPRLNRILFKLVLWSRIVCIRYAKVNAKDRHILEGVTVVIPTVTAEPFALKSDSERFGLFTAPKFIVEEWIFVFRDITPEIEK